MVFKCNYEAYLVPGEEPDKGACEDSEEIIFIWDYVKDDEKW